MRIVINTAGQRFGGAVQVALSFIHECRKFPQHEYIVWVGPGLKNSLQKKEFPNNFSFKYFDFGPINFRKTFYINRLLKQEESKVKPDVIISTTGPAYFHSTAPYIIGYNLGLYLYPESPFFSNLSLYRKFRRSIKMKLHHYFFKRDATAYIVQTDDVNQRVRKVLGSNKVFTVTNTASNFYQDLKKYKNKLPEKQSNIFRFVTISAYYGHKNLELIPKVVHELKKRKINNVEFVVTLKQNVFDYHIGSQPGIINIGPVAPQECPSLYNECDGMFLSTLAECFSASYPEAMIMRKPIVTTDLGFARSICGEAALYYLPMDAVSAADKIIQLIRDKELQQDLVTKGVEQLQTFDTPESRAEKYLKICEAAVNGTLDSQQLK